MLEAVVAIDARDLAKGAPNLDMVEYEVEIVKRAYRHLLKASLVGFQGTLAEPRVCLELPKEITISSNSS